MKPFITDDFLLGSDKAKKLYNDYAKDLPIIDYHCHLSPKEIAEDIRFDNIADIWLSHDHYKWRLMRAAGVAEELITGNAPAKDKFMAWAKVIGKAWGNPLFHWTSLELARYFGIYEALNEYNAEEVWNRTNEILSEGSMTATYFLKKSNARRTIQRTILSSIRRSKRKKSRTPKCSLLSARIRLSRSMILLSLIISKSYLPQAA